MSSKSSISQELEALLETKEDIEQKLASLERQIYALEGSYLDDTHHLGNIIRGWDGYLSSRSGALKKMRFKDADRLFSMSSVTAAKNVEGSGDLSGMDERPAKRQALSHDDSSPTMSFSSISNNINNNNNKGNKKNGPGRPRKNALDDDDVVDV